MNENRLIKKKIIIIIYYINNNDKNDIKNNTNNNFKNNINLDTIMCLGARLTECLFSHSLPPLVVS